MRILVVYGTVSGQTRKVVEFLAERWRAQSHTVEVSDATRAPAPAGFDATIVASPVRMGAYRRSVVRYVRRHRAALESGLSAFVSVSMAAAGAGDAARGEVDKRVAQFVHKTGWNPALVQQVAGALAYTRYDFITRWIMRRIAESQGQDTDTSRDHEYTDWNDLGRFADSFAAAVAARHGRGVRVRQGAD